MSRDYDFDAIVVGSGAGGAAFAHACAQAGKSTLLIERGPRVGAAAQLDERAMLIEKQPYDDRSIDVDGAPSRLMMGGVLGGGTAVFGAAMLRPSWEDFHPGRHYGQRLAHELWDWPMTYEELCPYYDEAESLYRVAATPADRFEPLNAPRQDTANRLLTMAPINERLIGANQSGGLRPFRLPLAIDADRCRRCSSCAGFLCPHGARRSAAHIIDEAAATHALQVLTSTEVEHLVVGRNGRVEGLRIRNRVTDQQRTVTARCYALAAGAIGSPTILLRSGMTGPHVGRNYMLHYSPVSIGIFPRETGADATFIKQVGFADFYFGTPKCPYKMGIIQSLPAPGPLMLAKAGLRRWPKAAVGWLRRRMLPLAGIIEDLPDPANRVELRADGGIALRHRFSAFDKRRGRALGREMTHILKRAGALACISRALPSRDHVGHQCGTLRCGTSPAHAVVDRDCRVFGRSNLFVVDGSILPTSLGVGPSLTIAANALRVARIAVAEL